MRDSSGPIPERLSALVVAGETSGDLHMAGVLAEIRRLAPDLELDWFGSGGGSMAAQGVELFSNVSDLAAIGPGQAIRKLGSYWRLFRSLRREAGRRKPVLAVLVDFPEFNLRLAPRLKRLGIPVCYFIGPQVWAWRSSRLESIRRWVDLMLVIFPFEEEYYRKAGVNAVFVGNPTAQLRRHRAGDPPSRSRGDLQRIALMPGSRPQEIEEILPVQLDAANAVNRRRECVVWLLQAPGVSYPFLFDVYRKWLERGNPSLSLEIRPEAAWRLLPQVDCAIIKSGTSTLEALVLEVPFAMVYRMSNLSYRLLRPWVRTDTFCLANLVAGAKIVPEFVQDEARGEDIADYLCRLLDDPSEMARVKQNLRIASDRLGRLEAHSEAARRIVEFLKDGAGK